MAFALSFLCFNQTFAQNEDVPVVFGKGMNGYDVRRVSLIEGDKATEVQPMSDGMTYMLKRNSNVRFEVEPKDDFVVFVWTITKGEDTEEIYQSYSSNEQTMIIDREMEVFADICQLVPITFIVDEECSTGKEVIVEEQGDFGRVIAPVEEGGDVYMLPLNRGAYFDPMPKDGYNILSWNLGEAGLRFPSSPAQFYKQNMTENFYISVRFYKDGETRNITYTQPKTANLTAQNDSEMGSPEVESGAKVEPGSRMLFEVAPFDNPNGKVDVHHWVVNGKVYKHSDGEYYTDNSLTIFADDDVDVTVVPNEEYSGIESVGTDVSLSCYFDASAKKLIINTKSNAKVKLVDVSGKCVAEAFVKAGTVVLDASSLSQGIYVLQQGKQAVKVLID